MVQNASRIPTRIDRLVAHQRMIKDHYGLNRMRTVPRTVSFPSSSTGEFGGSTSASGNYLPVLGGAMSGPIAFSPPSIGALKININNEISIGPSDNNSEYSGNVLLDILASASTQLDTIKGATFDGQYLVLRGSGLPQTITQRIALSITNITGDGTTNIIVVDVTPGTGSVLVTNNKVNIVGTTNYDAAGVVITKLSADTFSFDIGSVGADITETSGQVVRGNIQTYDAKDIVVTGADSFKAWVLIFDEFIADGVWRVLTPPIVTGGGGLTEPIILTPNVITPQTLPTKSTVNWNKNPNTITLDRAVEFDFSNLPASGKYEGVLVIIDIDGTGGFASPIWPTSLANPPVILTTPNTRFSVMLYTIDGGTIVTHATSVGSGTNIANASQWANFPAINDVNIATFDIQNIDRAIFALSDGVVTAANVTQILLNINNQFQFNTAKANDFVWSFNNNASLVLDDDASTDPDQRVFSLLSDSTVTDAVAFVRITHSSINSLDTQTIGHYGFYGTDDAGGTGVLEYAAITGEIEDSATGAIKGSLRLEATVSGASTNFLQINDAGNGLVDIFTQLDMNNKKIINLLDPTADQDAATRKFVLDNAGIQNQIAQLNSNVTVTDTGTNGLIQFKADNVLVAQMQNNRMDFQDTDVFGINLLAFRDEAAAATATTFTQNPSDLTMNFVDKTDDFFIKFNSVTGFTVDELLTRVSSTIPNTAGAIFELFRDDPSPVAGDEVGIFKFRGKNSASAVTTYAQVECEIIDPLSTNETSRLRWSIFDSNIFVNAMILSPGNLTLRQFTGTPTDKVLFHILKEDNSPGNGDDIGGVNFDVLDSGVTSEYAQILAKIENSTNAGKLLYNVRSFNSSTLFTAMELIGETAFSGAQLKIPAQLHSDIKFSAGLTVDFNAGQSNVGAAGSADMLPNRPNTYLIIKQGGTEFLVPAYTKP